MSGPLSPEYLKRELMQNAMSSDLEEKFKILVAGQDQQKRFQIQSSNTIPAKGLTSVLIRRISNGYILSVDGGGPDAEKFCSNPVEVANAIAGALASKEL